MMTQLTTHQVRVLGALLALDRQNPAKVFFSRWEIGCVVYGTCQGIHQATLRKLRDLTLVRPESLQAVDLVAKGVCRCGCDRWAVTDEGRAEILRQNVKVPDLAKPRRQVGHPSGGGWNLLEDENDPADWWKKEPPKDGKP